MSNPTRRGHGLALIPVALATALALAAPQQASAAKGTLLLKVTDRDTGKPIAARIHLKNARGKPVRVPKAPFWKDHFVIDGQIELKLPLGSYTFEMERGAEYQTRTGRFLLERFANDTKTVDMKRFVNMAEHGWYSGDLHIHRPPKDIEVLMRAEDLHVGPVITWWNNRNLYPGKPPKKLLVKFDGNRYYRLLAGEDERGGGALLYFNLEKPLPLAGSQRECPSPMKFLLAASGQAGVHIDIEKPFWWDVPVWIASGKVDSIGLANNHMCRSQMLANEAWGKPRDTTRFPNPWGNGQWTQHIYYHLLNCGIKLPPSAGSASGVLPNPVGYNRVYVHCGSQFSYTRWWKNLRAGKVVVTNGPLIRPSVQGKLPGHTFKADQGKTLELLIGLTLSTRDKIRYLEIIKNGEIAHEVRLADWAKAGGKLPPLKFKKSGWFLVRAVTTNPKTFRFASTGPYYVEIGYKKRISKSSARFFLDWVRERKGQIKLDDPAQQREVIKHHDAAQEYWQGLVEKANVE